MLSKKNKQIREQTRLEKRVAAMSTQDLTRWADQALFGIGRSLTDWGRNSEYVYLDDAKTGSEALLAVMTELCNRSQKTRNL